MRFLSILLSIGQVLCLLLALLYFAIMIPSFHMGFYQREFERNNVAQVIGIERDELTRVTRHLMDYMLGREDDLQITVVVQGEARPFFSQREIDHMVDVKDLFAAGRQIFNVAAIALVVMFVMLKFTDRYGLQTLARTVKTVFIGVLALLAILTVVISLDFIGAFHIFHEIFFNNDYWLLDPQVDLLINMVPYPFFINIAIYSAALFVFFSAIVIALSTVYLRRARRMRRWFS